MKIQLKLFLRSFPYFATSPEITCMFTYKTGLSLRKWVIPKSFPLLRGRKTRPFADERQGHQSRCHGLSTFLAELVVFWHRKSRNITVLSHTCRALCCRLRTEKSKYYTTISRHAAPLGIGKVEILQYYRVFRESRRVRNARTLLRSDPNFHEN